MLNFRDISAKAGTVSTASLRTFCIAFSFTLLVGCTSFVDPVEDSVGVEDEYSVPTPDTTGIGGGFNPIPDDLPTRNTENCKRGSLAIVGIERIPCSAIRLWPIEMARYFIIAEFDGGGGYHAQNMALVACNAYIERCDGDQTHFTLLDAENANGNLVLYPNGRYYHTSRDQYDYLIPLVNLLPEAKIVSMSTHPQYTLATPRGLAELESKTVIFVAGTGNDGYAGYLEGVASYDEAKGVFLDADGNEVEHNHDMMNFLEVKRLADANRLLIVAGYWYNSRWEEIKDPQSNGCALLPDSCIYAPFHTLFASGASVSVVLFSNALASVLAVLPETSGVELVKLAKTCAVAKPNLDGLGSADFTCMTVADPQVGWRLVTDDEFAQLHSPMSMNSLNFPGDTVLRSSFGKRGVEGSVSLATLRPGLFSSSSYSAGVKAERPSTLGFSAFAGNLEGKGISLGLNHSWDNNLFLTVAVADDIGFFGIISDEYRWVRGLDFDIGHKNFFVRVSRQEGGGDLIDLAEGTAVGVTAQKRFSFGDVGVKVSYQADKFLGGNVVTAFGDSKMQESNLNQKGDVYVDFPLSRNTVIVSGVEYNSFGKEATSTSVKASIDIDLGEGFAFSLDGSGTSDSYGNEAFAASASLNIIW